MSCDFCAARDLSEYDFNCLRCTARRLARSPRPSVEAQLRYMKVEWPAAKYQSLVALLKEEFECDQAGKENA